VTKIIRAGLSGALDNIELAQSSFRRQIAAVTDAVRQLGGAAEIEAGSVVNDPLTAPYVLYVNFYTGSDKFVSGSYSTSGSATQRIELQRLECGYTPSRPFKTISRAIIEAGIITSKSYYQQPLGNNDLVSIVLMPGATVVLNGAGSSVSEWTNGKIPTDAELQAFNTTATGGIILPRGCSLVAMSSDLRKTILRPDAVPSPAPEAADCSNRRTIFKVTGTGYYWGLTFMDKVGSTSSHHLLHCFEFASSAELDEFYGKIRTAFAGANNTGGLDPALAVTRTPEFEIVGPRPASGSQTAATDTTTSASPYIFNCSIRSNYGLCGVFADGAKPTGFKSMVLAQFTGVSLQKDLSCWQQFTSSPSAAWTTVTNYASYINADPDDLRMDPDRRSFHIRAINDAIMQEVSVFAIGQGIHHWTQSGGELTVTNSNSNFGGCAALAEGYKSSAFVSDSSWNVGSIRVATNLSEKTANVRRIFLGTVAESTTNTATTITLTENLADSTVNPGVPQLLDKDGYSLVSGHWVWVENTRGDDYRAQLASTPWSSANPNRIVVTAAFENGNGEAPGDPIVNAQGFNTGTFPPLAGARIYVRRLVDTRSVDERRYSLRCNNTISRSRTPVRDYVLQTTPGDGGITGTISDSQLLVVASAASIAPEGAGVIRSASVELRRANAANTWATGQIYRIGDVVRRDLKAYSCKQANQDTTFDPNKWEEIFVHMESTFKPEDFWKNTQPIIIFNNDDDPDSATCGYNLTTVWSTDEAIRKQLRSGVDYLALHSLLVSLGFSAANAHTILLPKTSSTRERNPASALDGLGAPSGAANAWGNWAIEFRRPSNIRLFGHAWEWAGFLNYSKSLPEYQLELSPLNKFTYYFTNKNGGRVYGSGFNEEGFLVTPQGLQDLATGNEITVENLGDRDVPIDQVEFPTVFDNITVENNATITNLIVNGNITGQPNWGVNPYGPAKFLPELPAASTTEAGIVELATTAEAVAAAVSDRAVTPEGLGAFQDDFLDRLAFMSDQESIVYVDGSVSTSGGNASYVSIPDPIWADIKTNAAIHGIATWTGTKPSGEANSDQYKFVRTIIFNNIREALLFINNRVPTTRSQIEIRLYGTSDSNIVGTVRSTSYTGTSPILIANGASATTVSGKGWGAVHYSGYLSFPNTSVTFQQVNLDVAGTLTATSQIATSRRQFFANNLTFINSRVAVRASTGALGVRVFEALNELAFIATEPLLNKNEINVTYTSASISRVIVGLCDSLLISSKQNRAADGTSSASKFELDLVINRTGLAGAKGQTAFAIARQKASIDLSPSETQAFSGSTLRFNFSGSNFTSFDFIQTDAGFSAATFNLFTQGTVNDYSIEVPNRGAVSQVYGVRSASPISIDRESTGVAGPLLPNQTGFLYTFADVFKNAGVGSASAYLWEIPNGSYRYGNFIVSGTDSVSWDNGGTAYQPPAGSIGSGTVTSVNVLAQSSVGGGRLNDVLNITGGPITGSGSLTISALSQTQGFFFAAPSTGNGFPTFRALASADLTGTDAVRTTATQTLTNKTLTSPTIGGTAAFAAGTAAAPSAAFGDTNTGFFRVSAGILGLSTSGTEALRVDATGRIASAATNLGGLNGAYNLAAPLTGSSNANGINYAPSIATDVTNSCSIFRSNPSRPDGTSGSPTPATTTIRHFFADQGTITGGFRGAVTNQYGFFANSNLTGATNNYGFYSNLDTAVGEWNFYANGTAPNYFQGDLRTATVVTQRHVPASTTFSANAAVLTNTALTDGIVTGTPTAASTMQLPTGTNMDSVFQELQNNQSLEWTLINLAATTNTITVTANTTHTVIGNMVVAANSSARFITRKTTANTFITYRAS